MKDPKRCAVLVPILSNVEPETERGLQVLERRGYQIKRLWGCPQLDYSRSYLASEALSNGFEELFWIDSDIGFNPDDVERLRESGHAFCAGLYPKKSTESLACQFLKGTGKVFLGKHGGLLEMLVVGFGFCYTEAHVYHTIKHQLKVPECTIRPELVVANYFIPATLKDDRGFAYLGDDGSFCFRARSCGYKVMADTRIRLQHFGRRGFTWDDLVERPVLDSLVLDVT